jgi:hypothetical protein
MPHYFTNAVGELKKTPAVNFNEKGKESSKTIPNMSFYLEPLSLYCKKILREIDFIP